MGDQLDAARGDAMLRRPAVDPSIPNADRAMLTGTVTLLAPAWQERPARRRDYLPTDPGKRLATVDGAVIGLTAAGVTAVFGAVPLAIGVLVLQSPAGWEYASNHYALLLAQIIAVVTGVVLGFRIAAFGQPSGRLPAAVAARAYHGRYLTDGDFDARSRVLLRRAQNAVDAVISSQVCRAGLLDLPAARAVLTSQEWDIAVALREQARLRARRSELPVAGAGTLAREVLDRQVQAAQVADSSVAERVAALERFAAEVRQADAAYGDWQQAAVLAELDRQHLDMVARTAADEHGIAEIEAMSQRAQAVRLALRQLPG
jgi:hypothetical protein